VASNLVKEHALFERRQGNRVELDEVAVQAWLGKLPSLDTELEASDMTKRLNAALGQLPGRWRTALILQYRYGLTYEQIAERLGVSSNMVKKYLAQGLAHCRRLMARSE
jgi:RNA polymerase sigma-70 factor (ECF subfamily)